MASAEPHTRCRCGHAQLVHGSKRAEDGTMRQTGACMASKPIGERSDGKRRVSGGTLGGCGCQAFEAMDNPQAVSPAS